MAYKDPIKRLEARRESRRKWRLTHPTQESEYVNARNRRLRAAALEILGNKCFRSPFSDSRALQIDHVKGDGPADREKREASGISRGRYYKIVIESVMNEEGKYQILCANCNWIKRVEDDEVYRKHPRIN